MDRRVRGALRAGNACIVEGKGDMAGGQFENGRKGKKM